MTAFGSHSEYGKLREVVIGNADNLTLPPFGNDLRHYNNELRTKLEGTNNKPLLIKEHFPEKWSKTKRQIEEIVKTFEDNDVVVHQLRPYSNEEASYLEHLQKGCSQLYPADPVFIIGNHYLEINIRRAYRRKEVFPIRDKVVPIMEKYSNVNYVAMPPANPWSPSGEGPGPFLEGGDILIYDKNIIVGMGDLCSNFEGIQWLTQYIEQFGYKVFPMPISPNILHALGTMCLLREGLLMAYLPALLEGLPAPLKNWDVIELTYEEMQKHASVGVSLDDKRYMIDPQFSRVIRELHKHHIEAIPTPCDEIGYWGGAIRCLILPLRRDA